MKNKMSDQSVETQIAVIGEKVDNIQSKVTSIESKLEGHYVTKEEFDPVKKIVYGLVSVVLLAVIGAIMALVIIKK
jgi:uncharacterized phage infection (PIP) family protein YhgE